MHDIRRENTSATYTSRAMHVVGGMTIISNIRGERV